jgi:proline dehydrogenase
VSMKLSACGQGLPVGGHDFAVETVRPVVEAASAMGTTVTLDMEDSRTVDSTLAALAELRKEHPGTGAVLQSMLFRTEEDARALAISGSRVRLVKGAYREPADVAFQTKKDVDAAYSRCLDVLMSGPGYPMVGSHDPALITLAHELAAQNSRAADSWEVQMLYGIRPEEQRRLAAAGTRVRAYVPYGVDWYAYFMRRLAERPANVRFFLRSLVTKS